MSAILESLQRSSINIKSISQTLSDTKKSTSAVNQSVENISRIVATNTKVKRELFEKSNILSFRREEASKRQELEDQIESTKVSTSPQAGLAFASRSEKGPLARLLGFLGFTFAGWILENLPTWIFMGQEFISRINSFGRSMYNMVYNMQNIIKYFGDTLGYSLNSILRLDFDEFAGEGTVARSFEELNLAVQDLGTNITDTFKLFTTPLTESLETNEQAPGLGETRPDTMFPGIQQETGGSYVGPETTAGGKVLNPQAAYAYMRQLGVPHIHALGILANIKGESGFRIDAKQPKGPGIGLFQYSSAGRKQAFLQNVPDWKTNWKGQIKYAIGEDRGPAYFKTQFSSPEEAAYWWMDKWERPDARVYRERNEKHNAFIRSFKPSSGQSQKSTTTLQATPQQKPKLDLKKLGFSVGERAGYSSSRGRIHAGRDIAIASGTPVSVISDATITDVGYENGYGYYVAYVDSRGIEHFYGHLREMPKVRKGQKLVAGTIVGYVGSTGRSTGPHLHWEVSPHLGEVGRPRKNIIDPIEYGFPASSPFGGVPAQISAPPKLGQSSAMTPERRGFQILFIDDTRPQVFKTSYSSQQQPSITPTVSEFKMLNNFIKNKLLLDLAYL